MIKFTTACKKVNVSHSTAFGWKKQFPEFFVENSEGFYPDSLPEILGVIKAGRKMKNTPQQIRAMLQSVAKPVYDIDINTNESQSTEVAALGTDNMEIANFYTALNTIANQKELIDSLATALRITNAKVVDMSDEFQSVVGRLEEMEKQIEELNKPKKGLFSRFK